MALFEGLLGGGGGDPLDLYGDLFTDRQRAALRDQQMTQGLLNAAAVFSKAGQASRLPQSIPWGEAAQALGGSGDEAMARMLKGMQVAEEVRSSRQKRGFADQVAKFAQGLLDQEKQLGLPEGTLVKPYLAATGGATGDPTASNAPPPPPAGGALTATPLPPEGPTGLVPPSGGSAAGAEWLPNLPPAAAAMPPPIYPLGDPNIPLPRAPGRTGGLLNPPTYDSSGGGLPGQGVLASLGGGGAGVPLPFGQGSPGSPDLSNIKIEQLSGEAAPAGSRPAPGDRSDAAWEYYKPIIKKLESGNRNIEQQVVPRGGGYNPSTGTVTGWSSASSPLQMLDSTFQGTARKAGIDVNQYPRAMNAPEAIQDEVGKALFKERGLQPWAAYNAPLARATGYDGPMANAGAGGGSGFSGRIEPLGSEAAPAGATPGKIPGLNISPQGLAALNMLSKLGGLGSPFESLLETYYKSPSYLGEKTAAETKARTDIEDPLNQRMKVLEMALDMRKNGILYNPQTGEIKADPEWDKIHGRRAEDTKILELDYAKRLKTFEEQQKIAEEIRKDQKEIAPQPIFRGGVIVEQPMTREAAVARLKDQSMRPGEYRDGDIVAKPIGNLSPDHQYKMSSTGGLTVEPIAGTPGAEKAAAAAKAKDISDRQLLVSRDIVVQDADRLENLIKTSPVPVTGMMGSLLSNMPGTPQSNAKALIDGLRARASIDAINRARAATGSTGMGQITMGEHALLANALANLEQSQGEAQLLFNLRRFKQEYIDAVHGPGAHSSLLPDTPVVKTPSSAPAGTAATSPADATRLRSEAADAIKAGKSRSAVIKRLQDMGVDAGGL